MENISFKEFQKLDIRTGKIIEVHRIENSDKLLKLVVDIGSEKRQLVAGIAKFYGEKELMNKNVVVLTNLEPKTFCGVVSEGMMLAADDEKPVLLVPEKDVPAGTKIR
ncbi:MAG: methionine--tRNA ligase subunit beta [Candidatus Aenigmarchaeota archaeon]|nr:methionine--tRNA ligase subunit beta [Candidatus Aenigmarchaeota archaeon]